jgi:signal transduction histidine kinase
MSPPIMLMCLEQGRSYVGNFPFSGYVELLTGPMDKKNNIRTQRSVNGGHARRLLLRFSSVRTPLALPCALSPFVLASSCTTAQASLLTSLNGIITSIQTHHITGIAASIGVTIFAATTAAVYVRERSNWYKREQEMSAQIATLHERADLANIMIASTSQAIVIWRSRDAKPHIEGNLSEVLPIGAPLLGFGHWLSSAQSLRLELAIDALKQTGEPFRLLLETKSGRHVEAIGQAVGRQAILRLEEVTKIRHELITREAELSHMTKSCQLFQSLAENIPHPTWLRDASGKIVWGNAAYDRAVASTNTERFPDLLERADREEAHQLRTQGEVFHKRVTSVIDGSRRLLDVCEQPNGEGFAGIAVDVSEMNELRDDMERQKAAHVRTLDFVRTAVAVFNGSQQLIFHNSAYRDLWNLEADFLEIGPTDSEILDQLRSERKLPEQADFKTWKAQHLLAYRTVDTKEDWWHLPDGRTLRVTTCPNSREGVTYLFDDMTEQLHLESRYNAFMRVQNETLDTLQEGVAVFGSDGQFKFCNPAFVKLWMLPADLIARLDGSEPIHIDEIANATRSLTSDDPSWAEIKAVVVGLYDARKARTFRIPLVNGMYLDGAVAPLPEGATLLTFTDVTAAVNVERALVERNEALERVSQIRDNFVHHVSYELRSPLTSIIGFAQLLSDESFGTLNPKQREYAEHITQSSSTLLAIINDILDLATIDNGMIELTLEPVNVRQTLEEAVSGVKDRLRDAHLTLDMQIDGDVGSFIADGKRIRQIMYNLLSNAIGFSSQGQTIAIIATRDEGGLTLAVKDHGRGIPQDVQDKIFNRFETHSLGSRHRGVGLGLAIVRSFVELHGGHVELTSQTGEGTIVACTFPIHSQKPLSGLGAAKVAPRAAA